MNILVCGGAGYIGSHMAKCLALHGYSVTVLDNLSTGHRDAVKWGEFVLADLLHLESIDEIFAQRSFDAVMHFSAHSIVSDSVVQPYDYYVNNVGGTLNLLRVMRRHEVSKLVFSSTAAVFGNPVQERIGENHPKRPVSPYGASKLMVERILSDAAQAYGLNSVTLRYFNAAGASPDGEIGESHHPETHLIPRALHAAMGLRPAFTIYGDNYPTYDGTCVRDYVHVDDVAQAHLLALRWLEENQGAEYFNLGNGMGFSVRQVIEAVEAVTRQRVQHKIGPARAGDPAVLVANSGKAERELNWKPKYTCIEDIILTAWRWHTGPGNFPAPPLLAGSEYV